MSNEPKGASPIAEADSVIVATTDPDREIDQELVDELLARAGEQNRELLGEGGLLQQLTKQVLETALDAELTSIWATSVVTRRAAAAGTLATAPHRRRGPHRHRHRGPGRAA